MSRELFDVAIIGAGPAGLSAALVLGRARRHVVVCDSGQYRNAPSRGMHGYLTREGMAPAEFLRVARAEVFVHETVELVQQEVVDVRRIADGFELRVEGIAPIRARKLLLATGVVDDLPPVEGAEALFGRGVYLCPYCDGWEVRDQPLAVYGRGDHKGASFALELTLWSSHIVLCTDGPGDLSAEYVARLAKAGIPVREGKIARLEGDGDRLTRIVFADGTSLACQALFFNTGRRQRSDFARRLGCAGYHEEGCDLTDKTGKTDVPGLYVIGDASRDTLQVIVAAAEGSQAAIAVNTELLRDDDVLGAPPKK